MRTPVSEWAPPPMTNPSKSSLAHVLDMLSSSFGILKKSVLLPISGIPPWFL